MDIGPTELPIQLVLPGEGIRRVERRSDAKQYPERQHAQDGQPEEDEHEAPHDSVDVSMTYRLSHPEHSEAGTDDTFVTNADAEGAERHLDIEA